MMETRIIVHDVTQARAALASAGALGRRVTLQSPAATSAAMGPALFAEICALARSEHAAAFAGAIFDCGDEAGQALAAIRQGGLDLLIDLPAEAAAKLRDMAAQSGARVIEKSETPVLDLADATAEKDAADRVRHFLETHPA
jgi:hypothetical protein